MMGTGGLVRDGGNNNLEKQGHTSVTGSKIAGGTAGEREQRKHGTVQHGREEKRKRRGGKGHRQAWNAAPSATSRWRVDWTLTMVEILFPLSYPEGVNG